MAVGAGSGVQVAYHIETTAGQPNTNPVYKKVLVLTESIGNTRDTLTDESLRSDRQISSIILGNNSVSGDVTGNIRYGAFDDFLQGVLGGTWATDTPILGTDQLLAGTNQTSFNIERLHTDTTAPVYFRNNGCQMSSLSLELTSNAIATASFSVVGLSRVSDSSAVAGASYVDAIDVDPMDSFTGSVSIDIAPNACVTSASISLDNGNESLFCIGESFAQEQTQGKSNVTGSLSIYFESATEYTAFNNATDAEIVFTLLDGAGNQYEITIPKLKFTTADTSVGDSGPLTYTYDFQAVYDDVAGSNIVIERTPA
jgi:hypothetical protein